MVAAAVEVKVAGPVVEKAAWVEPCVLKEAKLEEAERAKLDDNVGIEAETGPEVLALSRLEILRVGRVGIVTLDAEKN